MVRTGLVAALLAAVLGVSAIPKAPSVLPGAYIIEYEEGHDTKSFIASVGDPDVRSRLDLNYRLFRGSSIQFNRLDKVEEKVAKISRMPSVKKVWPVKLYGIPEHTVHWVSGQNDESQPHEGIDKRQAGANATGPDHFSPHIMTQVNQLRDKGVTGKGIKIAVVDTGVSVPLASISLTTGPARTR